jgi:hypothetical protein
MEAAVQRIRMRCIAVVPALTVALLAGCSDGQGLSVSVLEQAPDDRGVIAEYQPGPVRVRLAQMDRRLCLIEVKRPPTAEDPTAVKGFPDAGALACAPTTAHALDEIERLGWFSLGAVGPDGALLAGLVPDGYDEATAEDGRRWAVKDNLLVIAVDSVGELPESVQLQGSAKSRTLETSLFQ